MPNLDILLGGMALSFLIWISKVLAEKVVDHWVTRHKELEAFKDGIFEKQLDEVKTTLSTHREELIAHKIKLEEVNRYISRLGSSIDHDVESRAKVLEQLKAFVDSSDRRFTEVEDDIENLGKIILVGVKSGK